MHVYSECDISLFSSYLYQMTEGAETLRSRLYRLQTQNGEDSWAERGEGYPEFKRQQSLFRLRYYSMPGRELLYDITVDTNIQFQRSQNGIQWTQVRQNEIMAISFKQQFSANAFWQLIEEYQRKYAISVPAAEGIYFYFEYKVPDPTTNNLNQVLTELENIPQNQRHQRVASIFLTKRDLLPRLLAVFKRVEQSKQIEKLQTLFQIIKIVFNASNEQLFYELMCNEAFMGVLGILQYDPNFRTQRPRHREFILGRSKLLEVVPFRNTPELLNLVVFTYRLEYIRECILFPYLNDNGFGSSGCIIRNNYKKIFNHIFSNKRKDFINSLYDLLRLQDLPAFKLLRELFRIARIHYMPEIYQQIADKDTFQIFIRNLKELLVPDTTTVQKKKKKKPQQLEQIIQACLEILEQYMEHEPQHLRNFCMSEGEKVAKFPTCQFLLEQFQNAPENISQKLGIILKSLFGTETNLLKEHFKGKIIERFLSDVDVKHIVKWMPLFSQMLLPQNELIVLSLQKLVPALISTLRIGTKGQQIFHISVLKTLMHTYILDPIQIQNLLIPRAGQLNAFLWSNRGSEGIRVSAFLTLFLPVRFGMLLAEMIRLLREGSGGNGLVQRYIDILVGLSKRTDVVLPSSLRRAEQCLDEENFEKLSKKIKID